jgi:hypothetical protein
VSLPARPDPTYDSMDDFARLLDLTIRRHRLSRALLQGVPITKRMESLPARSRNLKRTANFRHDVHNPLRVSGPADRSIRSILNLKSC